MTELLVLVAPSANRVYAADAPRLLAAEIDCVAGAFGDVSAEPVTVAGVDYVSVTAPDDGHLTRVLSNLSATFGLFERVEDLLRPVPLERFDLYPSDLVTIQKYAGKTNEQWSRLMLNVTAASTARPQRWLDGSLQVLDPMCGRGTTLNLALLSGYDVTGVEVDRKDYEAYSAFIKTWLRQHRLKHTADDGALRTHGTNRGRRLEVEVAPSKEAHRAGDTQHVTYLCTDTTDLGGVVRSASVDVVVTDTPYGVQHGSHGERLARSPLTLLDDALPGWVRALRTGGAVGLSYNRHVAPRDDLAGLLGDHGLEVVALGDDADADPFRHRVDASIDRDLMVARKA